MRTYQIASAAVLSLVLAAPAAAQDQPAGGLPFAGCWAPIDGLSSRNRICLTPTGGAALEFTSITADGKVSESPLTLDGRRVAVKTEDCEGWEEGRLTSDGERIIVDAEITCGREPKQVRSTAFTITPAGYLLQATGTGLAMVANTQVRVYGPVESYAEIPPATREKLMPYLVSAEAARLGIRSNVVSAKDLLEFDRMGVAAPLIDVMVAASYPRSFVIDGVGDVTETVALQGNATQRSYDPFMFMNGYPMLSMYDWQMMFECQRIGFRCPINGYGYSAYGYNYGMFGSRYGYGGGWGGYGYIPGYGIPVVVRPVTGPSAPGGRAVRGRGYTQSGTSNSGGTAAPRVNTTTSGGSASTRAAGSSGSAGSSSSSGSSSSGGSTARTAKPRP